MGQAIHVTKFRFLSINYAKDHLWKLLIARLISLLSKLIFISIWLGERKFNLAFLFESIFNPYFQGNKRLLTMNQRALLFFLCIFLAAPTSMCAQWSLAKIFTNHMVLQRNHPIQVWGWAQAGDQVIVELAGSRSQTTLKAAGRWKVSLPEMKAGGPHQMQVWYNGKKVETLEDILVGDVWLCSGQSNMAWIVANSNQGEAEIKGISDPQIRHFKVPLTFDENRSDSLAGGNWEVANSETLGAFTAVGYYFAKAIRENQNVPIGLLNSSWGGSRIEAWMDAELFGASNVSELIEAQKAKVQKQQETLLGKLKKRFPEVGMKDMGLVEGLPKWANPEMSDEDWAIIETPLLWESVGYEGFDGIAWYRKTVVLNEKELQSDFELGLGKIDDSDISYVNGKEVGRTEQAYNKIRTYAVPRTYLRPGENVITVRVEDTGGGGGIYGAPESLFLKSSEKRVELAGSWRFKPSALVSPERRIAANHTPTLLYNKMIHPIHDFAIKGALWYQGESNAGQAHDYYDQYKAMLASWRKEWGIGDFPFLHVQLANFMAPDVQPKESDWAALRAAQNQALEIPNTGQAVIIDIGETDDIHPRNKKDVGYRLSLPARKMAYGESLVYSGPVYKSHRIEGQKMILAFDHVGGGLMAKDRFGYLKEFAIAGKDGEFHWAQAMIQGDEVVIWSDQVSRPVKVRYAWSDNPIEANLYNREGLPASPFETKK